MGLNFEEYIENSNKIMEGLVIVTKNNTDMIEQIKKDALTKTSDIIDNLKNDLANVKENFNLLTNKVDESNIEITKSVKGLGEKLDIVEDKVVKIEKFSETLRNHPTENGQIRRLANSLVYLRFSKSRGTVKDTLFHRIIVDRCYKNVFKRLKDEKNRETGSVLDINISDVSDVKDYIKEWFAKDYNIKYAVDNELLECLKNTEGTHEHRYLLAQKYLEMTNGGQFYAI